jgi:hypothetical protein
LSLAPPGRRPSGWWWKRLPLFAVALLGLWLWQGGGGLVPVERTLIWKLPGAYATVRRLELQLWDAERLLMRIEQETPRGLGLDPERKLVLERGSYRSEAVIWREGAVGPEVQRVRVEVGTEPVVVIQ